MTTLLHHEHAVKCDGCGAELLLPELDGRLCALCHAEIASDMKSEREQIEDLTRQRDRLLRSIHEYAAGGPVGRLFDAMSDIDEAVAPSTPLDDDQNDDL